MLSSPQNQHHHHHHFAHLLLGWSQILLLEAYEQLELSVAGEIDKALGKQSEDLGAATRRVDFLTQVCGDWVTVSRSGRAAEQERQLILQLHATHSRTGFSNSCHWQLNILTIKCDRMRKLCIDVARKMMQLSAAAADVWLHEVIVHALFALGCLCRGLKRSVHQPVPSRNTRSTWRIRSRMPS